MILKSKIILFFLLIISLNIFCQYNINTNYVTINGSNGYVQVGPQNTGWSHFITDRPRFYFDKPVSINGSIRSYPNRALKIETPYGYVDVGPKNAGWSHFETDRDRFYFNKKIVVDSGIISSYNEDVQIQTQQVSRITILNSNGNVGIGTATPHDRLTVDTGGQYSRATINGLGVTDPEWTNTFYMSNDGSVAKLIYNQPGSNICILPTSGNVGIGTENPDSLLTVNGIIHAKEIIVDTSIADYVFKPDYKLNSLEEVELFINKNGHLPDVPNELQVKNEGVSLGDMNRILLQKIEELTLYMIYMNKENNNLKYRIELLEKD